MSKNYLLAKIEIPLELDEEGEIKLMEKYMKLEIEETDKELKEYKEMPGFEAIIELFKSMKSDVKDDKIEKEEKAEEKEEEKAEAELEEKEIILTVNPNEIKKRIRGGYQHTFKNRKSLHNKTCNHQKVKISLVEQDAGEF
tara:strand:+ start:593 stop:1015 length:423 start_codon:yes stop_codon:yes gene_type:complete